MDLPTLITTFLTETPLPSPSPLGTSSPTDGGNGISQWLPLGTALVAAAAAIGASALSQFLSARNEGIRRTEQYRREDVQRRRDELKATYSELIRHLDELSLAMFRYEGHQDLMRTWERDQNADGMTKVATIQTELTEKILVTVSSINSLLGLVDLLEETAVHKAGTAYLVYLQHLKPKDIEGMAKGQRLNKVMKDAMRRSLAGEQDLVV